jgi:Carboxypeptidase regulatory-like domain
MGAESILFRDGPRLKILQIAAILGSLLATSTPSTACSSASCLGDGVETRRTFVVAITHGGRPLPGVVVEVREFGGESHNKQLFSSVAAHNGKVTVGELPPGNYWLNSEFLGISAGSQCFHVAPSSSHSAKKKIAYEWGDFALGVRQMSGRLVDSQPGHGDSPIMNLVHRVDVPIAHAKMRLQNPRTAAVYSTESDADGHFTFDQIPPGTYVLHVDGGTVTTGRDYESTDLLVALGDSANWDTLLLSRRDPGGTGCGGTYLELRNGLN